MRVMAGLAEPDEMLSGRGAQLCEEMLRRLGADDGIVASLQEIDWHADGVDRAGKIDRIDFMAQSPTGELQALQKPRCFKNREIRRGEGEADPACFGHHLRQWP